MALVRVPAYLQDANYDYAENATANINGLAITGTYPAFTGGTLIASVSITPKYATSKLQLFATMPASVGSGHVRLVAFLKETGAVNVTTASMLLCGDVANLSDNSIDFCLHRIISAGSILPRTYELWFGIDTYTSATYAYANPYGGHTTLMVQEIW